MNSLSWLIYAAGVSQNFGMLFFWGGALAIVCGAALYVVSFEIRSESRRDMNEYDCGKEGSERWERSKKARDDAAKTGASVSFWGRFIVVSGVVAWLLAAGLPSKETVYAIAASEIGEEIVKSETANKAMKALDAWLDKQIAPLAEKAVDGRS